MTWNQIELKNYGKGKLVSIVNEQDDEIARLQSNLDDANDCVEQCKRIEKLFDTHNVTKESQGGYLLKLFGRASELIVRTDKAYKEIARLTEELELEKIASRAYDEARKTIENLNEENARFTAENQRMRDALESLYIRYGAGSDLAQIAREALDANQK